MPSLACLTSTHSIRTHPLHPINILYTFWITFRILPLGNLPKSTTLIFIWAITSLLLYCLTFQVKTTLIYDSTFCSSFSQFTFAEPSVSYSPSIFNVKNISQFYKCFRIYPQIIFPSDKILIIFIFVSSSLF